jgi:hypothetical protein
MSHAQPNPELQTEPEAPPPKKDGNGIKWYDKRLLIPSLIIWLVLSGVFYALAMRHKPPEGYVFPREPVISGKYKCCEDGGRYSASWVGNVSVNCRTFGYYIFLGTNRNDCDLTQLNGHVVEATRVVLPSSSPTNGITVRITAYGQTYLDVSDEQIRERWIRESTSAAVLLAFILALIAHLVLQTYFNYFHKPTPRKGAQ